MKIGTARKQPPLWLLWALLGGCHASPLDVVDSPLTRGLVGHWTLDETSGTRAADTSGNGHDGTVVGGTWISGHFGGALHFEPGDEVQVTTFPQATIDWTVALWVRPASGDFGTGYITLVSAERPLMGGWEMNAILGETDRRYQFSYYLGKGDSDYYTFDCKCVSPDPEQWTHLAAVVEGGRGTLKFYRDGIFNGEGAPPPGATLGPIKPGAPTLYMGRWELEKRQLKGDLDDVVIYSRALSEAEISALAHASPPAAR